MSTRVTSLIKGKLHTPRNESVRKWKVEVRGKKAGQRRKELEPGLRDRNLHLLPQLPIQLVSHTGPPGPAVSQHCPLVEPLPGLGESQVTDSLRRSISSCFCSMFPKVHPVSALWQVSFCYSCGNYTSGSPKYYIVSNFFPLPLSCQMKVGGEPFSLSGSVNTPCSPPLLLKIPLLLPRQPICRGTLRRKQTLERKASS